METVFVLQYLINNDLKHEKGYEYTSHVTATDLENAKDKFKKWFKHNGWNTTWLKIKDYASGKEIIF